MWAEILVTNSRIPWLAGGGSTKVLECKFAVRTQDLCGGPGFNREGERRAESNRFEPVPLPVVDLLYRSVRAF